MIFCFLLYQAYVCLFIISYTDIEYRQFWFQQNQLCFVQLLPLILE